MKTTWYVRIVIAVAVAILMPAQIGHAQDVNDRKPMQIELRRAADSPLSVAQDTFGSITVFVGDTECVVIATEPESDEIVARVGTSDQPESCRTEGARVTLVNGAGHQLFETSVFEPGGTVVVENFAPLPPTTGQPTGSDPAPQPAETGQGSESLGSNLFLVAILLVGGLMSALLAIRTSIR